MKTAKTAWKHIRRSPYQALAAILIMMLTFLVISVFSMIVVSSSQIISYFEASPNVTAFFKEGTPQSSIDALSSSLKSTGKVSSIKFVSKQEAFKRYSSWNKNNPALLDLVNADVLPASLEISTYKIEDLDSIAKILKNSSDVSDVVFLKDVVTTLISWTDAMRKIGLALVVVLSVVSIFVMATIIGFKISQKREEIEIMRLLSATNWYIRWPFLLEGMFYGFIGAILGWLLTFGVTLYMRPYLLSFVREIPLVTLSPFFLLILLGIELLLALMLGALASFLAVLRYLK
ncbi:MAG TPA: permease-like cell division protein FtsX [Patescibacteria group bacterium]|nr:permease-like cell division protein FtsX [Patescibacteria group bacterium]